jgi:hypothetical protein
MLAMQYSIQLPPDYDAEAVRERVNTRSKIFDDHAGLVHKSFLYNEQDKIYAPFYLWRDVDEARNFLLDDLFKGVADTFNRPRARSWLVMHSCYGNKDITPTFARREADMVPMEEPLADYVQRDLKHQEELASDPNLYMHILAVDSERWEMLHFSLWKDKKSAPKPVGDAYLTYDVLHVSEPEE